MFKKNVSNEEKQKWKDEIVKSSESLDCTWDPAHKASVIIIEGQVTHEYGTVLNGFAAEIAPETFTLLTQSATDDGPISYIGVCASSGFADSHVNSGLFRTRWRGHHPIEKVPYP